jgi:hydroxymethylpyrimidine/phosphomethylpyrimidine kinase
MTVAVACTIAGSDSGGGAGIQADLKTFAALGVYGTSAIVALTAQNTLGVRSVQTASTSMVADQIDAIAEDFNPVAWKTGMLSSAELARTVVERLRFHRVRNLVVDPVMYAKSGDLLLEESAVRAVTAELLPLACVVTPNLPEAAALTALPVESSTQRRAAALALAAGGARVVVIKGGHDDGDQVVDVVYDSTSDTFLELVFPRVPGRNTHGTGCTFSAAIAAHLARGDDAIDAVKSARDYVQQALLSAPGLGAGHGPLGHFPTRYQ